MNMIQICNQIVVRRKRLGEMHPPPPNTNLKPWSRFNGRSYNACVPAHSCVTPISLATWCGKLDVATLKSLTHCKFLGLHCHDDGMFLCTSSDVCCMADLINCHLMRRFQCVLQLSSPRLINVFRRQSSHNSCAWVSCDYFLDKRYLVVLMLKSCPC